tara:strand:+ start:4105 stop:4614 length:510 start_codon:yes stop_codon:yes gene_type:complete
MSEYRVRATGEVKSQGQIRLDNKNMSLPKVWTESVYDALGVDPVLASPQPTPSGDFKVFGRNGVVQDSNGNWVEAWVERDMFQEYTVTDEEGVETTVTVQAQKDAKVAADRATREAAERDVRNTLLKETDYYALSDVTMSDAMKTYRQALRDVPAQSGFPNSITWPEKP